MANFGSRDLVFGPNKFFNSTKKFRKAYYFPILVFTPKIANTAILLTFAIHKPEIQFFNKISLESRFTVSY